MTKQKRITPEGWTALLVVGTIFVAPWAFFNAPLIGFPLLLVAAVLIGKWIWVPKDEGSYEEMAADPALNTEIWDLHYSRLKRFGYSKFHGQTEFMGPRGGIYTIAASGNRNYR